MPINAGSRITFKIVGATGAWIPRTPDTMRSDVIAALSQSLTVNSLNITKVSGGLFSQYPLVFGYDATMIATTKYGHAKIEDIKTIVHSAFWSAAGEPGTVSAPGFAGEVTQAPGTRDVTPSPVPTLLGLGSFTVIAAVAVAVFVFKRG